MGGYGQNIGETVQLRWGAARSERVRAKMHRRKARRARRRTIATACAGAACVWLALHTAFGPPTEPTTPSLANARLQRSTPTNRITMADGSQVIIDTRETALDVVKETETETVVRLARGQARFVVSKRPQRVFAVHAGHVRVQVLGTAFSVRRARQAVTVRVSEGRVEVLNGESKRTLLAGQSTSIAAPPPLAIQPTPPNGPEARPAEESVPEMVFELDVIAPQEQSTAPTPPEKKRATWREHATKGDYRKAFKLIERAPQAVQPEIAEQLLAADAARLSGHPAAALPYLRAIMDRHPTDPRAHTAAFLMGRIQLSKLKDPVAAAQSFAFVQRQTRRADLKEDAIVRRLQALVAAERPDQAASMAADFLRDHPQAKRATRIGSFMGK